ncbi:hypothetical protein [Paenibacillus silvae]|uniref:Uncharacterized protein n=1 Tax=Paenibacillus silvae TaxID=1325358 RepID=A0A2W6NNJ8_9BACL|nr:hypothetical protein [Paenibacillus silvae]PZT57404.1 hypothetical protein DN757_01740 [Paenibacillus silvae]
MTSKQKLNWVKKYLKKATARISKMADTKEYSDEMKLFYEKENKNIEILLAYHDDLISAGFLKKDKALESYMSNAVSFLRHLKFNYDFR